MTAAATATTAKKKFTCIIFTFIELFCVCVIGENLFHTCCDRNHYLYPLFVSFPLNLSFTLIYTNKFVSRARARSACLCVYLFRIVYNCRGENYKYNGNWYMCNRRRRDCCSWHKIAYMILYGTRTHSHALFALVCIYSLGVALRSLSSRQCFGFCF